MKIGNKKIGKNDINHIIAFKGKSINVLSLIVANYSMAEIVRF